MILAKAYNHDYFFASKLQKRGELVAETSALDENERSARMEARNEYGNMLRQKARIKWDVEGDENSKFFHSFIKRRNNTEWINYQWKKRPCWRVSFERTKYGRQFREVGVIKPQSRMVLILSILRSFGIFLSQINAIKWFGEKMEISKGCNSLCVTIIPKVAYSIGLGDFRPISLVGCYYKILAKLLADKVKRVVNKVVGDAHNAFIKGRYILDVAEGLNAIVSEALEKGIFMGTKVGKNNVIVPHLQYADDTIFFGEWNLENAKALMCILKCFEEVTGLKVNYNKIRIYGVGVNDVELGDIAKWMRCGVGVFPFTYFGLPIGENMMRRGVGEEANSGGWVWRDIIKVGEDLEGIGISFRSSFKGMVGNGSEIRFWVDNWIGDDKLYDRFPKLYHLDRFKEGRVAEKGSSVDSGWVWERDLVRNLRGRVCKDFGDLRHVLQNVVICYDYRDRWRWTLSEDGEFTVKELTRLVEERMLNVDYDDQATL
nr:putative ribonuclease H protein At1g65750 family [Tanacetum cinerariifolium]